MSEPFVVIWVDPNIRQWSSSRGGSFIDYAIKCKEPDGVERNSVITRKVGGKAGPEVGQTIYGHIEEQRVEPRPGQNFQAFTKRKLKEDSQSSSNGGSPTGSSDGQDPAFWAQRDRRISRAGILQAVVGATHPPIGDDPKVIATYVKDVDALTDAFLASLDRHTPHPSGPGLDGGNGAASATAPSPPAVESSPAQASSGRRGATSGRLTRAGIADRDTQKAIVAAFGGPTEQALDAIDAAIANQDWVSLMDEHGIERPPELPDVRDLQPAAMADDSDIPF